MPVDYVKQSKIISTILQIIFFGIYRQGYLNMEAAEMSDHKLIASIIIPVYNVELYLKECLDSIFINQNTIQKFEVIIIVTAGL